ncbi:hypothetical protein EMIT093MI4_50076 [Pseudomonas sp. IT-93MI4]
MCSWCSYLIPLWHSQALRQLLKKKELRFLININLLKRNFGLLQKQVTLNHNSTWLKSSDKEANTLRLRQKNG